MKLRPTIALACICKNEGPNVGPLMASISGCFDAIYVADTGSEDNTVDMLKSEAVEKLAGCPIEVSYFEWINDFQAARNFVFDQVPDKFDYVMWLDFDDSLSSKEAFIHFRDNSMHCADQWLIHYNYSFNEKGEPVCTFLRERIVKNGVFGWQFFLHEGLVPHDMDKKINSQLIPSFTVDHRRTAQDIVADRGRNISIFEFHKAKGTKLAPRMKYYYGKELHDAKRHLEAIDVLHDVLTTHGHDLEAHDRLMTIQYLSMAYGACEKWAESLQMALQGFQLHPERAEFWILAGDAQVKVGKLREAIPFYEGATKCSSTAVNGMTFTDPSARLLYPHIQLATIYRATQDLKSLEQETKILEDIGSDEAQGFRHFLTQTAGLAQVPAEKDLIATDDIIFTSPPQMPVTDWDEKSALEQGFGGSETACIEVAKWIKKKTGKPVKVFQPRASSDVMPSGVEYYPIDKLKDYIFTYKPAKHVAWRHATKLTPASSYVWCHDLVTPGAEMTGNYDKIMCLSNFHREYVRDMQGIPNDKIVNMVNGIDPDDFPESFKKQANKVIFSSSPDRGLDRSIFICKKLLAEFPDLELHVFYGFDNMRKVGDPRVEYYEKLIADNSFVKYHGMVKKPELMRHMAESVAWLYPADFIETYCITAIEAICSSTYPLVRNMGSLKDTLSEAVDKGMATFMDVDARTDEQIGLWAKELGNILREERWRTVEISPQNYTWERAADRIIEIMEC